MTHQTLTHSGKAVANPGLTLALIAAGGLGGWLALTVGLRAPWFFGALVTTTVCAALLPAGLRRVAPVPRPVSRVAVAILAAMFGSQVGQRIDANLLTWLPSIGAVVVFVVLGQALGFWYFRRVGRLSHVTAWYAASPGGFVESTAQSGEDGADQPQVALMHFLRIIIILLVLPLGYSFWFGLAPRAPTAIFSAGSVGAAVDHLPILGVVAIVFLILRFVAIPGGPLVLSFVISAGMSIAGFSSSTMSPALLALGQIAIGAALGTRFGTLRRGEVVQALYLAVGHTAMLMVLAFAISLALHVVMGLPVSLGLLVLAPAGIAEMAVIGASFGADPLFIIVHHVVRLGTAILAIPLTFKLVRRHIKWDIRAA